MGYSSYDDSRSKSRSIEYSTKSREQIFESKSLNKLVNPLGLTVREARDSEAHPITIPIIYALDVTGSMGHIPEKLVKGDLAKIVGSLIQSGVHDPSLAFLAIGDQYCDRAPLQVGQFESGDVEQDTYLTSLWLEGGGGAGIMESYELAWLVAARHTATDAWEKRALKGYLFTVGDEATHREIDISTLKDVLGYSQASTISTKDILKEAQEKWNVFHIHINHRGYKDSEVIESWKELLGQNLLITDNSNSITKLITETIIACEKSRQLSSSETTKTYDNIIDLDNI